MVIPSNPWGFWGRITWTRTWHMVKMLRYGKRTCRYGRCYGMYWLCSWGSMLDATECIHCVHWNKFVPTECMEFVHLLGTCSMPRDVSGGVTLVLFFSSPSSLAGTQTIDRDWRSLKCFLAIILSKTNSSPLNKLDFPKGNWSNPSIWFSKATLVSGRVLHYARTSGLEYVISLEKLEARKPWFRRHTINSSLGFQVPPVFGSALILLWCQTSKPCLCETTRKNVNELW